MDMESSTTEPRSGRARPRTGKPRGLLDELIETGLVSRDFVVARHTYRVATRMYADERTGFFRSVVTCDGAELAQAPWKPIFRDVLAETGLEPEPSERRKALGKLALEAHLGLCHRVGQSLERHGKLASETSTFERIRTWPYTMPVAVGVSGLVVWLVLGMGEPPRQENNAEEEPGIAQPDETATTPEPKRSDERVWSLLSWLFGSRSKQAEAERLLREQRSLSEKTKRLAKDGQTLIDQEPSVGQLQAAARDALDRAQAYPLARPSSQEGAAVKKSAPSSSPEAKTVKPKTSEADAGDDEGSPEKDSTTERGGRRGRGDGWPVDQNSLSSDYSIFDLAASALVYGEDSVSLREVPASYAGFRCVTTLDSEGETDQGITFDLLRAATVLIGFDRNVKRAPAWIADFQKTGATIGAIDTTKQGETIQYEVFEKKFEAGRVSLGAKSAAGKLKQGLLGLTGTGKRMYFVCVR